MHVSLTPELENRVKAKVQSGLYNNASDVVREALRFMDSHAEWVVEINRARFAPQTRSAPASFLNRRDSAVVDQPVSLGRSLFQCAGCSLAAAAMSAWPRAMPPSLAGTWECDSTRRPACSA